MPARNHPQTAGGNRIGMVHLQGSNGGASLGCFPTNDGASLNPFEMVLPSLRAGIEQRNIEPTFGIDRLLPVGLVTVAHWTSQKQIFLVRSAAPCFGDDMVDLEEGTNNALRVRQ